MGTGVRSTPDTRDCKAQPPQSRVCKSKEYKVIICSGASRRFPGERERKKTCLEVETAIKI